MSHEAKQWNWSSLITLLVFFLFALTLLMVILTGAGIYKRTVDSSETRFETRSVVRYLTTRIRQADSQNQIVPCSFGDGDALMIREELDGETYCTWIYCHDGWLRELFCAEESLLSPEDGEKIVTLESLALAHTNNGIQIRASLPKGSCVTFFLHLRTTPEVIP